MKCVFCSMSTPKQLTLASMVVFGHSLCEHHARVLAERIADGESVRKILAEVLG